MAGIVPKKQGSGRKQWTLHGGQKNSLKRLRSQMASDGCPESQVVLAKQLLEEECGMSAKRSLKKVFRKLLSIYCSFSHPS
ncbi:unnamed protein product [Acanthoscelides obtectus]|uniref:Uncharacterized protein n=1 Tax=Acanthoscelides obtectus TaxID=200917 RepID=A0A9P0KRS7_ACAOB|nr:unnamed protein product [Acanthoscelides obtectus]CAK1681459.1 hypothetical protein AOBTE_LOCUS33137 [Acanthoscelides obtectus]